MSAPSQPYRRMLLRWLPFARAHFRHVPDQPDASYIGTGHNSWGTMAQASVVGALGYLAGMDDWPTDSAISRDEVADMLRGAFRFFFRTHRTGDMTANNGEQWGFNTGSFTDVWHPPVYFEQALTSLPRYRHLLDAEDIERMNAALAFESNAQAAKGLSEKGRSLPNRGRSTNPESNSWTAAMLARSAIYMPAHAHAANWLNAASLFWTNALSVPQDEWDPTIVDGRSRSAWFAGPNLGPHYTLEHHGFFHPGYYVWSLWPMATALLEFRRSGRPPLQAAMHHFSECFNVVKRNLVWDGRLAFPAGADWPQYIYGQAFLVALSEYVARAHGDAEAAFMAESLRANMEAEHAGNEDGSFISRRFGALRRVQPISYYRYDTDGACVAALAACFCDELPASPKPVTEQQFVQRTGGVLVEQAIGLALDKSPTRYASASFNAEVSKFQSLVIPPGGGHLLRHSCNGYGRLVLAGTLSTPVRSHQDLTHERRPVPAWHQVWQLQQGFVAAGQMARQQVLRTNVQAADQYLAVFALPDGRTVVQIELVRLRALMRVLESGSGGWMLATDIFTAPGTKLSWPGGDVDLGRPVEADNLLPIRSLWVNLADRLGIIGLWGGAGFALNQLKRRNPDELWTRPRPDILWPEESLTADELYFAYENYRSEPGGGHLMHQGSLVRDAAFAQVTGLSADQTADHQKKILAGQLRVREGLVRGATIRGTEGRDYLLAVNFDPQERTLPLSSQDTRWKVASDAMPARFDRQRLILPPRSCLLAWSIEQGE